MFNRLRAMLRCMVLGSLELFPTALSRQVAPTVMSVSKKRKYDLFDWAVQPGQFTRRCISPLRTSVAQGKRNAAKRRNQRRHKRLTRR